MGRNAPSYYAVAKGKNVGIYKTWNECRQNTHGVSNATFKKFSNMSDAQSFIRDNSSTSRGSMSSSGGSRYDYGSGYSSHSSYSSGGSSSYGRNSGSSDTSSATRTKVYVDGAARGNGRGGTVKAGYGVYYGPGDDRNRAVPLSLVDDTSTVTPTNQRAELHALNHALDSALESAKSGSGERYQVYTDSSYAKNCVDNWSQKWVQNNWVNSKGEPVANSDLIKEALSKYQAINELYSKSGDLKLEITHVRGHAGNVGNEMADKLANEGADAM